MRVTPTGQSEYKDGRQAVRYARDISRGESYAFWYHGGLRREDEPSWAMETDVAQRISVSVDAILVAEERGLFRIERRPFLESIGSVDGKEQLIAKASDPFVHRVGDPEDHATADLWRTCDNGHGGYHKQKNEA